jgi:isopentenyl phosphate kinase
MLIPGRAGVTQILKIGGSLLTRPGVPFEVASARLAAMAGQIAEALQPDRRGGLVVVHGLGTFGRAVLPLYSQDRIPRGRGQLGRRVLGLLAELNRHVVDALDAAGVPVSPLDTATVFAVRGTEVLGVATETVRAHLAGGRVPVLSGGTILDVHGDFVLMSSDRVTSELAAVLPARRILWATDVDAVMDQDKRPMTRLDHTDRKRMWLPPEVAADPSGAMHGKVDEALRLAGLGIQSVIFNGMRPGRLADALSGSRISGTLIEASGPTGTTAAEKEPVKGQVNGSSKEHRSPVDQQEH